MMSAVAGREEGFGGVTGSVGGLLFINRLQSTSLFMSCCLYACASCISPLVLACIGDWVRTDEY